MEPAFANLVAATVAFVGTHFALSHPLRGALVRAVGDKGFQAVYSLVALATLGWTVWAFRALGPQPALLWDGSGNAMWIAASLLTLVASVLLVGSFAGNPALPDPRAAQLAARGPHGVFHVTRHPMMWSIALWGAAHILVSPDPRTLVFAGSIAFLALVGAHLQDRKKEVQMGAAWQGWEAQTSYWPRLGELTKAGAVPWLAGTALWLGATWAHVWAAYVPAGVWRWVN